MSIVGRNPPPEPGKPIYYCGTCGRGSTAGPCPEHEAAGERDAEHAAQEIRPIPKPRPGSKEEIDMGRDRGPEPGNAHSVRTGAIGFGWHLPARSGAVVSAVRQLEAEAG